MLGSSNYISDPENGNFLGKSERLSKYEPLLSKLMEKVRKSQQSHKPLQVHSFSTRVQNHFTDLCGSFVQTAIINEIHIANYFSNIIDDTSNCSHQEQTTFIIRYLNVDGPKMSIEERFLLFDNFMKKSGKDIASCVLKNLICQPCLHYLSWLGHDNGANMAGAYKGVQAVLQEVNSSCLSSPNGNHTLNLVIMLNHVKKLSPTLEPSSKCTISAVAIHKGGEILKTHMPVSLYSMSKTR